MTDEGAVEVFTFSVQHALRLVEERTSRNQALGSRDRRVDGANRDDPDRVGVPAELAGRQWDEKHHFGYEWADASHGPDPGWDFRSRETGRTGDIKATRYSNGHLLVAENQLPVKADRLILAYVNLEEAWVMFRGWVSREKFNSHSAQTCPQCGMSPQSGRWMHPTLTCGMNAW